MVNTASPIKSTQHESLGLNPSGGRRGDLGNFYQGAMQDAGFSCALLMPWVKLDDSFFCHPKVVTAGAEASGLYVWSLTYSAHNLTDGKVPSAWVRQAVGSKAKRLAAVLVECGLWSVNGTGWLIHDYLDYNPTRADVRTKRERDSARKSRG